jgi:hypothetical protein
MIFKTLSVSHGRWVENIGVWSADDYRRIFQPNFLINYCSLYHFTTCWNEYTVKLCKRTLHKIESCMNRTKIQNWHIGNFNFLINYCSLYIAPVLLQFNSIDGNALYNSWFFRYLYTHSLHCLLAHVSSFNRIFLFSTSFVQITIG